MSDLKSDDYYKVLGVSATPPHLPVHAAAAAAAATTRVGGLHTSIEMFENMGISTPAEIAQLNKVLTHLRLLATENGSWQKTSEDDVVKAWRTLGNRLLLSRGNASYPAKSREAQQTY